MSDAMPEGEGPTDDQALDAKNVIQGAGDQDERKDMTSEQMDADDVVLEVEEDPKQVELTNLTDAPGDPEPTIERRIPRVSTSDFVTRTSSTSSLNVERGDVEGRSTRETAKERVETKDAEVDESEYKSLIPEGSNKAALEPEEKEEKRRRRKTPKREPPKPPPLAPVLTNKTQKSDGLIDHDRHKAIPPDHYADEKTGFTSPLLQDYKPMEPEYDNLSTFYQCLCGPEFYTETYGVHSPCCCGYIMFPWVCSLVPVTIILVPGVMGLYVWALTHNDHYTHYTAQIALIIPGILSLIVVYFFFAAWLTEPGILPAVSKHEYKAYKEEKQKDKKTIHLDPHLVELFKKKGGEQADGSLAFYRASGLHKSPRWKSPNHKSKDHHWKTKRRWENIGNRRAKFCRATNNCVENFDHFCPWIGNAVGARNYKYFVYFLSSLITLVIYVLINCVYLLGWRSQTKIADIFCWVCIVVGVVVLLSLGYLYGFHLMLIYYARNTNEQIMMDRGKFTQKELTDLKRQGSLHTLTQDEGEPGCHNWCNFCSCSWQQTSYIYRYPDPRKYKPPTEAGTNLGGQKYVIDSVVGHQV